MSPSDVLQAHLIIGTRHDGSRVVIENGPKDRAAAERRAAMFREMLEGYVRIDVETCDDGLGGLRRSDAEEDEES